MTHKCKSPKVQHLGKACLADAGRTKAKQMDHSSHFQLCTKLDPLPQHGLLAVSNKQLVIASMSSVRWRHVRRRGSAHKTFLCLCLFNEHEADWRR